MDGSSNSRIGSAAADVARHRLVNVLIRRLGFFAQQHGGAHQLPRLAVAALRNVLLQPRALQRITQIRRQSLDGRDSLSRRTRHWRDARAHRVSIDVHRAGAALRHAASIFRSGETKIFANDPEQWSGRVDVEIDALAIDGEADHESSPVFCIALRRQTPDKGCQDALILYPAARASAVEMFSPWDPQKPGKRSP